MATKVINALTFGDTYVLTTPYATCSTAAGTAAKVATITPGSAFSLETGVRVSVKFTNALSVAAPTLNVNSSGAKAIYFRGATLTSAQYWAAGSTVDFVYDGTYWQMLGSQHNSTYSLSSFGITATAAELNYTDGVTSNIQTQLNSKLPTAGGTLSGDLKLSANNVDRYIWFNHSDTNARWRIGVEGSGSGNANYFVVESDKNTTNGTMTKALHIGMETLDATFGGNVTAPSFIGNLTGNAATATAVNWSGVTDKPTYYDAKAINGITRSGTTFTYTCLDGTTGTFTQQDSDTKVTQNAAITTAGNYPVILGNSTSTTAVTGSVNKSATLLFDPSSSTLIVGSTETGGYEEEPIGNLYVSGDAIIGGGSDSFGIIPGQDNYSHVGTSNRRWFDGHFTNMYCNNYYDYNGNSLTSQFLPKSGGTLTGATTVNAGVALQLNTLKLPTTSGGTTYGVGSSGQVLKSNGSTVYWGSDSNTTYSYPNLMGCSCNTVDSTAAKTASLNGFSSTHLKVGAAVFVRFTYPHTGTTAATFNLSSTGAKTIKRAGKSVTEGNSWAAYEIVKLIYDGTYWQYISMSGPEWHQYST